MKATETYIKNDPNVFCSSDVILNNSTYAEGCAGLMKPAVREPHLTTDLPVWVAFVSVQKYSFMVLDQKQETKCLLLVSG